MSQRKPSGIGCTTIEDIFCCPENTSNIGLSGPKIMSTGSYRTGTKYCSWRSRDTVSTLTNRCTKVLREPGERYHDSKISEHDSSWFWVASAGQPKRTCMYSITECNVYTGQRAHQMQIQMNMSGICCRLLFHIKIRSLHSGRSGTISLNIQYTRVIFYVRRIGQYLYKYRIYGTITIYILKGLPPVYHLI